MPRRLLVFVLFVVGLLVPTIASAAPTAYAGARIGVFDVAVHVGVGLSVDQAAEKHRGIGFTCDEIASGSPHAAEGGGGVRLASGAGGPSGAASVVRPIAKGEKVADLIEEAKGLTYSTGQEHAVVSLKNGQRVLVSGAEGGMSFEGLEVRRILGHTHPYQLSPTGPSAVDVRALQQLGQRSSWLLEHGTLTRFRAVP